MNRYTASLGTSLFLLAVSGPWLMAGPHEKKTLDDAGKVLYTLAVTPNQGIPPALMRQARAVAIIPHVVKAGLVLDHRFGRGVILVRQPDGHWGNPIFLTLEGSGVGIQAGVESSDLILVFDTEASLERILRGNGRLTLGSDVALAVGRIGKEVEVARPGKRKAEIYAYSRSKGLFAGVSLEGDRIQVEGKANEGFYSRRGIKPADVLTIRGLPAVPAVEYLKGLLTRMSQPLPPPPAAVIVPRKR